MTLFILSFRLLHLLFLDFLNRAFLLAYPMSSLPSSVPTNSPTVSTFAMASNRTTLANMQEVIQIMQNLDAILLTSDGLKWFNQLYLRLFRPLLNTQQHSACHQELDGFKEEAYQLVPKRGLARTAKARD